MTVYRLDQIISNASDNGRGIYNNGRSVQRGQNATANTINKITGRKQNAFERIGNGINGFNERIGNGIDNAFDNVVGALVKNEDKRERMQNRFDGSDLAIIPDLIEDIGLAALGAPGIAAAVAKNGLQNAQNFTEAFSGVDEETGQELKDGQRLAKGAGAVLNTALAATPGRVLKGVAKVNEGSRAFNKIAAKNEGNLFKQAAEQVPPPGVSASAYKEAMNADTAANALKYELGDIGGGFQRAANKAASYIPKTDANKAAKLAKEAKKEAKKAAKESGEKAVTKEAVVDEIKETPKRAAAGGRNLAQKTLFGGTIAGNTALNAYGENGENWVDALSGSTGEDPSQTWRALAGIVAAMALARRGVNGAKTATVAENAAQRAALNKARTPMLYAAASGNYAGNNKYMDDETMDYITDIMRQNMEN